MPIWKQHLLNRYQDEAKDETGQGTGAGGGDDIQAQIRAAVEKEVAGLKAKNNELIGTNKSLKENLTQFDGIDPQAVRAILAKFASDEEAALIAKGDIDTVLNKRTERMKSEYDKQVQAAKKEAERLAAANAKLSDRALSEAIMKAASKAGALPEAMEDIVYRARAAGFRVNADGEVVSMNGDDIVLGKDGKTPLTAIEWAESLRDNAPHLWPKAQGTGAPGSNNTRNQPQGNLGGTKAERLQAIKARFGASLNEG